MASAPLLVEIHVELSESMALKSATEISSTLAAILASNFENRVVCDGPSDGSCSCVYTVSYTHLTLPTIA